MKKLILLSMLAVATYGSPRSGITPEVFNFEHRGEQYVAVAMRYISESGDKSRSPTLVGPSELVKRFDASVGTADTVLTSQSGRTGIVRPGGGNWIISVKGVSFVTSDSKVYRLTQNLSAQPEIRVLCEVPKGASQEALYKEIQKSLATE